MAKHRRQRQKLHSPAKNKNSVESGKDDSFLATDTTSLPPLALKDNIFSGININFGSLNKLSDGDVQSVKSFKSMKSEKGGNKILPKKEKIKLRREVLLKKIDTVNQMKKELKVRNKRKNTSLIGDTNPLHDALPSLESLLKNRPCVKNNKQLEQKKRKCIEKSSKRNKKSVQDISLFKQTIRNTKFKNNPFQTISTHIKAVVENGRLSVKK